MIPDNVSKLAEQLIRVVGCSEREAIRFSYAIIENLEKDGYTVLEIDCDDEEIPF